MHKPSDRTPAPKFTPWAPGDDGKGLLVRGAPHRIEVWKVHGIHGEPVIAAGMVAFGLEMADCLAAFAISAEGLTAYWAEVIDGRPVGDVLRELDPRLPPDEAPDETWDFG